MGPLAVCLRRTQTASAAGSWGGAGAETDRAVAEDTRWAGWTVSSALSLSIQLPGWEVLGGPAFSVLGCICERGETRKSSGNQETV